MNKPFFIDRKIWEGYLTTEPQNDKPQPSNNDLSEAFTWGYIASLHVHAILDCEILFGEDIDHVSAHVRSKVHSHQFTTTTVNIINADLSDQTARYLLGDKPMYDVNETCRDAFIAGYKVALVVYDYYDRCLFEEGHIAECTIIADLLSCDKKRENAARAAARIVMGTYGLDNSRKYRDMVRIEGRPLTSNTDRVIAEIHAEGDGEDHNNP